MLQIHVRFSISMVRRPDVTKCQLGKSQQSLTTASCPRKVRAVAEQEPDGFSMVIDPALWLMLERHCVQTH